MTTVAEITDLSGQLPELIKQVQNGVEILLTQSSKPVARLLPVPARTPEALPPLDVKPFTRPKVLTPQITRAEIAEDMFGRK